jgi:hypothetical protein
MGIIASGSVVNYANTETGYANNTNAQVTATLGIGSGVAGAGAVNLYSGGGYPKLQLNFLSGSLDPRITFSRSSNATIINSDGNIAYAPHNLLTNSEQFNAGSWNPSNVTVTANTTISPDGAQNADLFYPSSSGNSRGFSVSYSATGGVTYTHSVYAKANGLSWLSLGFGALTSQRVFFNVLTGTIGTIGTAVSFTASITPAGNGWYRCTISYTRGTTGTTNFIIEESDTDNSNAVTANGTNGIFLWGAQLEIGSTATTYNSTTPKNLLGFTEEFDNAAWTKSNSSIDSVKVLAPNGFNNAQKLVENTATSVPHGVTQAITTTANPYVFSVYAKAAERSWLLIGSSNVNFGRAWFNLSNGTKGTLGVGASSSSIEAVGNGWYRCSITLTPAAVSNTFYIYATTGNDVSTYTGDGTSGIYIWGAQLSNSASLDPYVYNPAAALTSVAYYGPRFTYDPVTKAPQGLLIEEQRSNLLLQSEAFNTSWSATRANVTANVVISPDGTQDADKLYADGTAANTHRTAQAVTVTNATAYTITVYAKASELSWIVLYELGSNAGRYFNLSSGVTGAQYGGNSPTTSTITPVGNGWYRCQITITSVGTTATLQIILANADGGAVFDGDNTSGIFIWGAQLEAGSFTTSYIPTAASQVTRTADVASINGSNFYSWYNQNQSTLFVNGKFNGGQENFYSITGASYSNFGITQRRPTTTSRVYDVYTNNTVYVGGSTVTVGAAQSEFKEAVAFTTSSAQAVINGIVGSLVSGQITTENASKLLIGQYFFALTMNGTIKQISYYPVRLSNDVLKGLTA